MKKFFAAANTENGFFSLFDEIFAPEKFRRIYILKGGPGTGKSTLMRRIGALAESKGYEAEYIFCSSDPDSLDGVIIEGLSVAVLDGTAPHTTDPLYPGAVERIVDLGEAFDLRLLEKKREELIPLIKAKKQAYRTAYRFLSAAGSIEREHDGLLRECYLAEKADAAVKRLIAPLRLRGRQGETKRYISAVCQKGFYRLNTLSAQAERVYAVTDKHGLGYLFMDTLYERLASEGFSMILCPSPVRGDRKEAIFLCEEKILFSVTDEEGAVCADKIINSARFADKEGLAQKRRRLRFIEKCEASVIEGAISCFAEAGALHAKAERIYGTCVDFGKVDAIMDKIISEIFANNV
ncbi:MAG: hypothetical protein IKM00_00695 [Clostridia bacterium]|nr:hypothetical protein [Clostridia bacterium]